MCTLADAGCLASYAHLAAPHRLEMQLQAPAGWRTAERLGLDCAGTCVLRGCVPKKLMVIGGEFASVFQDSKAFG